MVCHDGVPISQTHPSTIWSLKNVRLSAPLAKGHVAQPFGCFPLPGNDGPPRWHLGQLPIVKPMPSMKMLSDLGRPFDPNIPVSDGSDTAVMQLRLGTAVCDNLEVTNDKKGSSS